MNKLIFLFISALLLAGCEEAKQAGDETVREITGSNMIRQGEQVQQQLHNIERQKQDRVEQMQQE